MAENLIAFPEAIDLKRRFSGLDRLYGEASSQKTQSAHIVVVGIGGVGSWAAEALARSGIARLTLIDLDHVSESNINRQIHALGNTLGMAKVIAMQQRISQINPLCKVRCIDDFVEPGNWLNLLPEDVDAVIDACDNVKAKTFMAHWARTSKSLFISVGAAGGKRHSQKVKICDLSEVTHDPLLSKVRYQLRKEFQAPRSTDKIGIHCVFSDEPVLQPNSSCAIQTDGSLNCHGYGSLVTVTATFGMCAAGWVMDKISKLS